MTPTEFEQEAALLAELEDFLKSRDDTEGLLLAIRAHAQLQLMVDSTDEEVIDVLLPVQELRRERDELRAELETLEHAHADVLDALSLRTAEVERLAWEWRKARADLVVVRESRDKAEAQVERLRGFLKYLIGEAQDRDDLSLMDEIDKVLGAS